MKSTLKNESDLERYFYTVDEQGSTALIINQKAGISNEYYYDAFGNILESKEDVHNRITYTGQQFDNVIQQYYLRARFYNPKVGRFTQEDIYHGDGLNLYAYCNDNPVTYYDPSGFSKKKSVVPFKNGKYSYDDINSIDFGKELKKLIGEPPKDMVDPHAHHICFKIGNGAKQKELVKELQNILVSYDIDPIISKEVLGWAPNRVKGQHDYETLKKLGDDLKDIKLANGSKKDIINVLNSHKEAASSRKLTSADEKVNRNGKCKK